MKEMKGFDPRWEDSRRELGWVMQYTQCVSEISFLGSKADVQQRCAQRDHYWGAQERQQGSLPGEGGGSHRFSKAW